ncbi:hypothetical protein U1Q18_000090, partial [Sarracenia purpurea var. burkii]
MQTNCSPLGVLIYADQLQTNCSPLGASICSLKASLAPVLLLPWKHDLSSSFAAVL